MKAVSCWREKYLLYMSNIYKFFYWQCQQWIYTQLIPINDFDNAICWKENISGCIICYILTWSKLLLEVEVKKNSV